MEIHIHDSLAAADNPGPNSIYAKALLRALVDTKDFDNLKLAQAVQTAYSFFLEAFKAGTFSPQLYVDFTIFSSLLAERLANGGVSKEEIETALNKIVVNGLFDKN